MSDLRILALLEATSISGTAKAVLEMAYEARADVGGTRRIEVIVANFARGEGTIDNALTRALLSTKIPYSMIREEGRFDASVLPQLRTLVKKHGAQVVWSNSVKSHFLVHKSGVQKSCKWVAFHHGYTATDLKMRLYNQLDRISLRNANRVLTVCKPFAEQMMARGVKASRIRVQHMPIRSFSFSPEDVAAVKAEFQLQPDARVILSVGRLSREKGHIDLLRAFAQLRDQLHDSRLTLLMVGDGPERKRLEQQAASLDCAGRVIFTGHRDDVKRFYGLAAVFALPSYTEGTPNVVLEAMAAGVPVVATKVGGLPELAVHQKNALLVSPSQPAELALALKQILQSAAFRNELTAQAAEVVASHSPQTYFANMRDIFLEVAAE